MSHYILHRVSEPVNPHPNSELLEEVVPAFLNCDVALFQGWMLTETYYVLFLLCQLF